MLNTNADLSPKATISLNAWELALIESALEEYKAARGMERVGENRSPFGESIQALYDKLVNTKTG